MSAVAHSGADFLREHLRARLTLVMLVAIPALFVLVSASVLGEFSAALGGSVGGDSASALGAGWAAAFLAGALGFFQVSSSRDADRRLALAGYRPGEAIAPRLAVLVSATLVVLAVSLAVTAIDFAPASWGWFAAGNLLAGLIYGAIGALAGALVGRLGAAYLMFFLPMMDIGVAQNPMFFDGAPQAWATVLPGYGPTRVLLDGAFSPSFDAAGPLAVALLWLAALSLAVVVLLRRSLGGRRGPA